MPKVSRDSATGGGEFGPVTDRSEELEGYTVNFVTFHAGHRRDPAPEGPAGRPLPVPALGLRDQAGLTFRYPDRDEVFEAGDAFYTPPGHAPVKHEPGTEIVQFSPADELEPTEAAMQRNMKAMQTA